MYNLNTMEKVFELKHPLIQHKLTHIRKKETSTKEFKEYLNEITRLMAFEVLKDVKLKDIEIETPIMKTIGKEISDSINLFPILRAGLGMVDGFVDLMPNSRIGHIGIYRNEETLKPVPYLFKYPKDTNKNQLNIVLDPMIATGGSALEALDMMKKNGFNKNIKFVAIVATKEAIEKIREKYPEIDIYVASIDNRLNDKGYIEPGLGDAGDRIFGTK